MIKDYMFIGFNCTCLAHKFPTNNPKPIKKPNTHTPIHFLLFLNASKKKPSHLQEPQNHIHNNHQSRFAFEEALVVSVTLNNKPLFFRLSSCIRFSHCSFSTHPLIGNP